jgi:putative transposase
MKNLESGVSAEVLARDYGVTGATLYNWKPKYRGMAVSQVRRLKKLEEENWK